MQYHCHNLASWSIRDHSLHEDLLHMLFGFHQRVGCGCRGKLWFMFEYKTCLYFPKGTNNKGLEQAKEHLGINELPALYNKALRDWVWLLFVTAQEFSSWNAAAPRRHLNQGIKRN